MKLSVSNLAWRSEEEASALEMLEAEGVDGVEVAPSLAFGGFTVADEPLKQFRARLAQHGLAVPALQSILFGHPDLQVFDPASHEGMLDHLSAVANIASGIGGQVLVFGAPSNRRRGDLSDGEATGMAADLFRMVGQRCADAGVFLALEHNPAEYGCDWLTSVDEVESFLGIVDHPAVGLNVDTAGLAMSGGDYVSALAGIPDFLHFHLSAPFLAPLDAARVDFAGVLTALRGRSYGGWVSIEMKRPEGGLPAVRDAVRFIKRLMVGPHEALTDGDAGPAGPAGDPTDPAAAS